MNEFRRYSDVDKILKIFLDIQNTGTYKNIYVGLSWNISKKKKILYLKNFSRKF